MKNSIYGKLQSIVKCGRSESTWKLAYIVCKEIFFGKEILNTKKYDWLIIRLIIYNNNYYKNKIIKLINRQNWRLSQ